MRASVRIVSAVSVIGAPVELITFLTTILFELSNGFVKLFLIDVKSEKSKHKKIEILIKNKLNRFQKEIQEYFIFRKGNTFVNKQVFSKNNST